ncbi:DJ-1/PfpI family protein [Cellulomonas sp. P22]|uniref:DJ-1/PfpI family protein n=1 Tax=Cellulomonas sp. P22 TaxID=3373189 RepID=UPI0037B1DBDB
MGRLTGTTVAFVTSMSGIEDAELAVPWSVVRDEGGTPVLVAPELGEVATVEHGCDPVATYPVGRLLHGVVALEFDALVLPGGTVNGDRLRILPAARELVRGFTEAGKPVAAICHAPWVLIDAGVAPGKTLTSAPSVGTDLRNAGATWVDAEVFVDRAGGWTLVTSRGPDDLPAFCTMLVDVVAEAAGQ